MQRATNDGRTSINELHDPYKLDDLRGSTSDHYHPYHTTVYLVLNEIDSAAHLHAVPCITVTLLLFTILKVNKVRVYRLDLIFGIYWIFGHNFFRYLCKKSACVCSCLSIVIQHSTQVLVDLIDRRSLNLAFCTTLCPIIIFFIELRR